MEALHEPKKNRHSQITLIFDSFMVCGGLALSPSYRYIFMTERIELQPKKIIRLIHMNVHVGYGLEEHKLRN
jgi:hypothetical protein